MQKRDYTEEVHCLNANDNNDSERTNDMKEKKKWEIKGEEWREP